MKKIYVAFLMLLVTVNVFAQSLPKMKDKYVTDAADILSNSEYKQLRSNVKAMCDYYSTRIVVGTVSTFGEYDIEEYAGELAEKWDLSDENTMLILVKPKSAEERGEAMLLASSDLKDVFSSDVCDQIVHDQMIPHFKNNDYFGGIEAALEYMNNMTDEEEEPQEAVATSYKDNENTSKNNKSESNSSWLWLLIGLVATGGLVGFFILMKGVKASEGKNQAY